jgi:methanol corrinoid protein
MLDVSSVNYDAIFRRYDILVESKEKPEDIAAKILPKDALLKKVAEDVVFMKYKDIEADTKAAMEKFKPEEIIDKALVKGMDVVAELRARYILPAARHGRRRCHGPWCEALREEHQGRQEDEGQSGVARRRG